MDRISNSSSPPYNSSPIARLIFTRCGDLTNQVPVTLVLCAVTFLFLLPLFLRVLCLADVRRSRCVAAATTSDLFTLHLILMELVNCLALVLNLIGWLLRYDEGLGLVAELGFLLIDFGRPLFHCCTCVERYLAVVHPITYLGLKGGGARLWHVAAGCVWLLTFGWVGLNLRFMPNFPPSLNLGANFLCLLVILFCCLSVLRALIRPGPGDRAGVDQSKRRAFRTITAILGALAMNLAMVVITNLMWIGSTVDRNSLCLLFTLNMLFPVPSSAVQPLLFLHRAGKIPGCRHSEV